VLKKATEMSALEYSKTTFSKIVSKTNSLRGYTLKKRVTRFVTNAVKIVK